MLRLFRQHSDADGVLLQNVKAVGTSAIRNARNGEEFCQIVARKTGILIEVISGAREAELIYEGVRLGIDLGEAPSLSLIHISQGSSAWIFK